MKACVWNIMCKNHRRRLEVPVSSRERWELPRLYLTFTGPLPQFNTSLLSVPSTLHKHAAVCSFPTWSPVQQLWNPFSQINTPVLLLIWHCWPVTTHLSNLTQRSILLRYNRMKLGTFSYSNDCFSSHFDLTEDKVKVTTTSSYMFACQ